jgi:hypothetical protein
MMERFERYWKFYIAAIMPVFLVVQAAITDSSINTEEVGAIVAAVLVAFGVLSKSNGKPPPDSFLDRQ